VQMRRVRLREILAADKTDFWTDLYE